MTRTRIKPSVSDTANWFVSPNGTDFPAVNQRQLDAGMSDIRLADGRHYWFEPDGVDAAADDVVATEGVDGIWRLATSDGEFVNKSGDISTGRQQAPDFYPVLPEDNTQKVGFTQLSATRMHLDGAVNNDWGRVRIPYTNAANTPDIIRWKLTGTTSHETDGTSNIDSSVAVLINDVMRSGLAVHDGTPFEAEWVHEDGFINLFWRLTNRAASGTPLTVRLEDCRIHGRNQDLDGMSNPEVTSMTDAEYQAFKLTATQVFVPEVVSNGNALTRDGSNTATGVIESTTTPVNGPFYGRDTISAGENTYIDHGTTEMPRSVLHFQVPATDTALRGTLELNCYHAHNTEETTGFASKEQVQLVFDVIDFNDFHKLELTSITGNEDGLQVFTEDSELSDVWDVYVVLGKGSNRVNASWSLVDGSVNGDQEELLPTLFQSISAYDELTSIPATATEQTVDVTSDAPLVTVGPSADGMTRVLAAPTRGGLTSVDGKCFKVEVPEFAAAAHWVTVEMPLRGSYRPAGAAVGVYPEIVGRLSLNMRTHNTESHAFELHSNSEHLEAYIRRDGGLWTLWFKFTDVDIAEDFDSALLCLGFDGLIVDAQVSDPEQWYRDWAFTQITEAEYDLDVASNAQKAQFFLADNYDPRYADGTHPAPENLVSNGKLYMQYTPDDYANWVFYGSQESIIASAVRENYFKFELPVANVSTDANDIQHLSLDFGYISPTPTGSGVRPMFRGFIHLYRRNGLASDYFVPEFCPEDRADFRIAENPDTGNIDLYVFDSIGNGTAAMVVRYIEAHKRQATDHDWKVFGPTVAVTEAEWDAATPIRVDNKPDKVDKAGDTMFGPLIRTMTDGSAQRGLVAQHYHGVSAVQQIVIKCSWKNGDLAFPDQRALLRLNALGKCELNDDTYDTGFDFVFHVNSAAEEHRGTPIFRPVGALSVGMTMELHYEATSPDSFYVVCNLPFGFERLRSHLTASAYILDSLLYEFVDDYAQSPTAVVVSAFHAGRATLPAIQSADAIAPPTQAEFNALRADMLATRQALVDAGKAVQS